MTRRADTWLVDGLTEFERIGRVEATVFGNRARLGLERDVEELRHKVEELESAERRRRMPFYLRWWVRR